MNIPWGDSTNRRYRIKLHNGQDEAVCVACAASFQDAVLIAGALEREGAIINDIELLDRTEGATA